MPADRQQYGLAPARADRADAPERRSTVRRAIRADRALVMTPAAIENRQWVPRRWPYLILCLVAAVGSSALAAWRLPGPFSGSILALAIVLAALVQFGSDWARGHGLHRQAAAALVFVIFPMFLFG